MKQIAICVNQQKDPDFSLTSRTAHFFRALGAEVFVTLVLSAAREPELPGQLSFLPLERALARADVLVCIGGDGTILHAAAEASGYNVPVVGINLGQRGYMAEIEPDELDMLSRIISGDYSVERRMMLDVTVERRGEEIFSGAALNDAVVSKGAIQRIIELDIRADGRFIMDFSGDGVVICTPTGSTAYSLSSGGPIIEPDAENIVVTPICAHSLLARPFVLKPERTVTVRTGNLEDRDAWVSIDGNDPLPLESGDLITICCSRRSVQLLRLSDMSFYENISYKLNRPRGGAK